MRISLVDIPIDEFNWDDVILIWRNMRDQRIKTINWILRYDICNASKNLTSIIPLSFYQYFDIIINLHTSVFLPNNLWLCAYYLQGTTWISECQSIQLIIEVFCWFHISQQWNSGSLKMVVFSKKIKVQNKTCAKTIKFFKSHCKFHSSMTILVNLFIRSVISKVTIVT